MPSATTQTGTPVVRGAERVGAFERFSPSESIPLDASVETGTQENSTQGRVGVIESELAVLDRGQASARARRALASAAPAR